jgi:hypothetical protein
MFDMDGVEPWTGLEGKYQASRPRVMVVGEARYDVRVTDREIILGKLRGTRHLTFTNFQQAAVGKRQWEPGYEAAAIAFWERTLFYNYNTTYVPGTDRLPPPREVRAQPQNARVLRAMLAAYRPTHTIVWGEENWLSMAVADTAWEEAPPLGIGTAAEPCRRATVDGHPILFTRVAHPAASFAFERWAPLIAGFLARPA